ncbi:MAG: hypothetical protein R2801_01515 [Chitinophagales bacterium]
MCSLQFKNIGDISKPIENKICLYIIQKLDEQKPVGYNEVVFIDEKLN